MKNLIYTILILSLSGCFGKKPTLNTGHEGKPIPSMSLLLIDSTTHINLKDDISNKPIVLFYFSPQCPYCRALTKSVINNINKFSEINIYMFSSFPITDLRKYSKEFELNKYSTITIGQDYEGYFREYYKSPGVPCLAIYNKEKKLKEVLMGNVSPNLIRDIAME